jgi:hypothetical protein
LKRIARPGEGKRGGYRTLVATNRGSRWIFIYGFAKNARNNIDPDEEAALKTREQRPIETSCLRRKYLTQLESQLFRPVMVPRRFLAKPDQSSAPVHTKH